MQRVYKGAVAAFLSDYVVALDPVSVHLLRGVNTWSSKVVACSFQTQSNCDTYLQTMEIDSRPKPPPDMMIRPFFEPPAEPKFPQRFYVSCVKCECAQQPVIEDLVGLIIDLTPMCVVLWLCIKDPQRHGNVSLAVSTLARNYASLMVLT